MVEVRSLIVFCQTFMKPKFLTFQFFNISFILFTFLLNHLFHYFVYFKGDKLITFNKTPGFSMNDVWNDDFIFDFSFMEIIS